MRLFFVAVLALGGALVAVPAQAATLSVCASGCTHSTIAAAVAAAAPGDTVEVGAGTYVENGISVTKAITIRGAGRDQTIVDGGGLATSPRVGIFQIRPAAPATSGTGSITVSGMTVRNPSKQGSFYMNFSIGMKQAATGVTDITLDDLDVQGTDDATKWNYGVYADGGNPIAGAERRAPALNITNSRFTRTAFNNIGADAWVGPVRIENNDLTESVASGSSAVIVLNEYTAAQIGEPVVVRGNRSTGRLFWLSNINQVPDKPGWSDVSVLDNTVTGLGANDIAVYAASNTTLTAPQYRNGRVRVAGNAISGVDCPVGSAGVVLGGMIDDAVVEDNTIAGAETGVGIRVVKTSSPTALVVHQNTITGCGSTPASYGVNLAASVATATVGANTIANLGTGVRAGGPGLHPGTVAVTGNSLRGATQADDTGVSVHGLVDTTTVEGNNIVGWGQGVAVSGTADDQPGEVDVTRNRILGNQVGLANTSTTTVSAEDDWWGCQAGPTGTSTYCNAATGLVTATHWIRVHLEATGRTPDAEGRIPAVTGEVVPVVVSVVRSDGTTDEPVNGLPPVFDAFGVAYDAQRGTLAGGTTVDGDHAATATYTAPGTAGEDLVHAVVDREDLSPTVTGEPVPLRFAVTARVSAPLDPLPPSGPAGAVAPPAAPGVAPAHEVSPAALPNTGANVPRGTVEGAALLLAGGLLLVLLGACRPAGRHRA